MKTLGDGVLIPLDSHALRRQVNNYFLPKTAAERRAVKQKTTAMLSAKVVGGGNWLMRSLRGSRVSPKQRNPELFKVKVVKFR